MEHSIFLIRTSGVSSHWELTSDSRGNHFSLKTKLSLELFFSNCILQTSVSHRYRITTTQLRALPPNGNERIPENAHTNIWIIAFERHLNYFFLHFISLFPYLCFCLFLVLSPSLFLNILSMHSQHCFSTIWRQSHLKYSILPALQQIVRLLVLFSRCFVKKN